jgi:hypothetical protein
LIPTVILTAILRECQNSGRQVSIPFARRRDSFSRCVKRDEADLAVAVTNLSATPPAIRKHFSAARRVHASRSGITMKSASPLLAILGRAVVLANRLAFLTRMSDPLYLSLWFPDFSGPAMLPHILAVLQQFPFSAQRPGITYAAVQPVSWSEATILERRFTPGIGPEEAVTLAADLVHDDYAYILDAHWDLWTPDETGSEWSMVPAPVKFIAQGEEFDDGTYEQTGHVQIDFGLDTPFLQENLALTEETQMKVRANVSKLVEFTMKAEKNTRATARLLWSESEENLAQKLIARLQKVQ